MIKELNIALSEFCIKHNEDIFGTICFNMQGFWEFKNGVDVKFIKFEKGTIKQYNGFTIYVDPKQTELFRIVER